MRKKFLSTLLKRQEEEHPVEAKCTEASKPKLGDATYLLTVYQTDDRQVKKGPRISDLLRADDVKEYLKDEDAEEVPNFYTYASGLYSSSTTATGSGD